MTREVLAKAYEDIRHYFNTWEPQPFEDGNEFADGILADLAAAGCVIAAKDEVEALRAASLQQDRDIGILLGSIEFLKELTDEGPEGEDLVMVTQIKRDRDARAAALTQKEREDG